MSRWQSVRSSSKCCRCCNLCNRTSYLAHTVAPALKPFKLCNPQLSQISATLPSDPHHESCNCLAQLSGRQTFPGVTKRCTGRMQLINQSLTSLDASDCSMACTKSENSEGILFASKNIILLKFFSVLIPFHFSLHGVVLLRLAKIKVRSRKLILPLANPAWTCTELLFPRKKNNEFILF